MCRGGADGGASEAWCWLLSFIMAGVLGVPPGSIEMICVPVLNFMKASLQVLVGYVSLLRFTVDYFVLILEIDTKTKCISKLKGSRPVQGYHNV